MKLWTVDAFATQPFTGNPAAVMILDHYPADEICQKIAAEMNLSETAFVKSITDNQFQIRWFTPRTEVKLCGHATLASAHILYQEKIVAENVEILFASLSGELRVKKSSQGITLNFPLQKISTRLDKKQIEAILKTDIVTAVQAYDDIIIELPNEENIRDLKVNIAELTKIDYRGIIITTKGNDKYDFVSRFFAPREGIDEDPVTGSAHCKLADYWQQKLGKTSFLAYQASERGGELSVEIKEDRVFLTGKAFTILEAEFLPWSSLD